MSKFCHFAVKKLYFKRSFNNICGNRGPLFSQINSDQTYFGGFCPRVFGMGFLSRGLRLGVCPVGLCPRTSSFAL